MTILRKARLVAAILLLFTTTMPLSECSWTHNGLHPGYGYEYAYALGPIIGAFTVLAYIWPLLFTLLLRKQLGIRLQIAFQALEVLFCAGSIYWFKQLTFGEKWLYGAYVAVGAVAAFRCAGLASWFERSLT
jgi:hypothetical protein